MADAADGGEINSQHHRENHPPDENGDRQVDARHLQRGDPGRQIRQQAAKEHSHHDRQTDPEGEIALEESHQVISWGGGSRDCSRRACPYLGAGQSEGIKRLRHRVPSGGEGLLIAEAAASLLIQVMDVLPFAVIQLLITESIAIELIEESLNALLHIH